MSDMKGEAIGSDWSEVFPYINRELSLGKMFFRMGNYYETPLKP